MQRRDERHATGQAAPGDRRPLRVAVLSWRDSDHPEGGGAELYLTHVVAGLVAAGHEVTLLTARPRGAAREVRQDGYRVLRAGGRLSVYALACLRLLLRRVGPSRLGPVDVVVDVQNGVPFFSRLVTRLPVVVLCHHVHREQWPVAFGSGRAGRVAALVGWWLEATVAPRLYRGCRYVTVSRTSAHELAALGVRPQSISVVHNGTPAVPADGLTVRSATPELVVLGRLVPHKQVEHAVRAVAALSSDHPDLRLTIVGQGWWEPEVRAEVTRLGLDDRVQLTGFVSEQEKATLLSRAWISVTPSLKEGWGLCVVEAGAHGTPSVAYQSAGGVAESVVHGVTGWLAVDERDLVERVRQLLDDDALRRRMGVAAQLHAGHFTWETTSSAFGHVLALAAGRRPAVVLPTPARAGDELVLPVSPSVSTVAGSSDDRLLRR